MDQTAIAIDMNSHSTIEFVGAQNLDVVQGTRSLICFELGCVRALIIALSIFFCSWRWAGVVSREHFLCASVTGVKIRPLIVYVGALGFNVEDELLNDPAYDWERAQFTVQGNVYCDETVMKLWVEDVWAPETEWLNLLLLDSFKVHTMATVKSMLETVSSMCLLV